MSFKFLKTENQFLETGIQTASQDIFEKLLLGTTSKQS
jgi:hypothetical protein